MYVLIDSNSLFKRIFYSIYSFKKNDHIDLDRCDDSLFYSAIIKTLHNLRYTLNCNRVDIILLYDQKVNNRYFRHDIFEDYKSQRLDSKASDNSIILKGYYNKLLQNLHNHYLDIMYNSLSYDYLEADDIAFIISQNICKKFIIVSYDKDYVQSIIKDRVYLYNPNLQSILNEELNDYDYENHIMFGDASDGVPSVFQHTKFTDDFIEYLQSNNITVEDPLIVEELNIFPSLKKNYPNKVYKNSQYRINRKELKKYFAGYLKQVKNTPILLKHYERNKRLIDLNYIPDIYIKPVCDMFNNLTPKSLNNIPIKVLEDSMLELELVDHSPFLLL
jgi:hypothetical protein